MVGRDNVRLSTLEGLGDAEQTDDVGVICVEELTMDG